MATWFRCVGYSVGPFGNTLFRSASGAHLHSDAFQTRLESEPRVQLLKVLQCICCERVDCRILPCLKVQMFPFAAASEPGDVFVEALQCKVFQCIAVVFEFLSGSDAPGCSAARFVEPPARSTSGAHLQSVAFQPRLGSEPRVQLPKPRNAFVVRELAA